MSLTRIKDAFAIFKNIVLEVRAAVGNSTGSAAIKGGDPDVERQIEDLRMCLLQRDTEIAILVNMVKKGKSADVDVSSAEMTLDDFSAENGTPLRGNVVTKPKEESSVGKRHLEAKEVASNKESSSGSVLKEDREKRIIQRHLFGVAPPSDHSIFDDMPGRCYNDVSQFLSTFKI